MKENYLDIVRLVERMHRQFLDVLRVELRRLSIEDINAVQALLLHNIGEEEMVIRDLKDRGYYHGSNVSYNIKKLTETGYITQERCAHDRRSIRLRLSEKGMNLCQASRKLQERLAVSLGELPGMESEMETASKVLQKLETVWGNFIHRQHPI